MKRVVKSILVPYSAREVFDIVTAVDEYPTFLPWCGGAVTKEKSDTGAIASITIAFGGVTQQFTTRNVHTIPTRIDMSLVDGPFRHLEGHWQFKPLSKQACKVSFELEYDFKNSVLELLIGPVFSVVAHSFVDAFAKRAAQLHGERL